MEKQLKVRQTQRSGFRVQFEEVDYIKGWSSGFNGGMFAGTSLGVCLTIFVIWLTSL